MGGIAVLFILSIYIVITVVLVIKVKGLPYKAVALLVMLLIPTADAIYGRYKLKQMCAAEGGLKVYRVAHGVAGFMASTADEIWIKKYGFQFSEGSNSPGKYYRISKQNDQIVVEENIAPKSNYRIDLKRIDLIKDTYMRDQYFIEKIANGEILATDTQVYYNGGRLERLIAMFSDAGAGAVARCPNADLNSWIRQIKIITNTLKN